MWKLIALLTVIALVLAFGCWGIVRRGMRDRVIAEAPYWHWGFFSFFPVLLAWAADWLRDEPEPLDLSTALSWGASIYVFGAFLWALGFVAGRFLDGRRGRDGGLGSR